MNGRWSQRADTRSKKDGKKDDHGSRAEYRDYEGEGRKDENDEKRARLHIRAGIISCRPILGSRYQYRPMTDRRVLIITKKTVDSNSRRIADEYPVLAQRSRHMERRDMFKQEVNIRLKHRVAKLTLQIYLTATSKNMSLPSSSSWYGVFGRLASPYVIPSHQDQSNSPSTLVTLGDETSKRVVERIARDRDLCGGNDC